MKKDKKHLIKFLKVIIKNLESDKSDFVGLHIYYDVNDKDNGKCSIYWGEKK